MTKAEFVKSQIDYKKDFMDRYDLYIASVSLIDEDEEIITLTEEVLDEENTNSSRYAQRLFKT